MSTIRRSLTCAKCGALFSAPPADAPAERVRCASCGAEVATGHAGTAGFESSEHSASNYTIPPDYMRPVEDESSPERLVGGARPGGLLDGADGGGAGLAGATLAGRYQLKRPTSRPGVVTTFPARDTRTGTPVVVQVVRAEVSGGPGQLARLSQEAHAAAASGHPGVARLLDSGRASDGSAFLALAPIQGKPLRELLAEGPLAWPRARDIGVAIGRVLAAAHERGVVHRALRPEGIYVTDGPDDGVTVTVAEFGLGRLLCPEVEAGASAGPGCRLPEYVAPEVITAQPQGPRVDVYGLGLLLYEMVTGLPPFSGPDADKTLSKHLYEPATPPRQRRPELVLPGAAETAILRALEKDPARRFESIAALIAALEQADSIEEVPRGRDPAPGSQQRGSGASSRPHPVVRAEEAAPQRATAGPRAAAGPGSAVAGLLAAGLLVALGLAALGWVAYLNWRAASQDGSHAAAAAPLRASRAPAAPTHLG